MGSMRFTCIILTTLALTAHAKQLNVYERMADETLEEFNDEFNIIDHLPEEAKAEEEARLKEMEDKINKNNNDPDSTFKEALNPWSDLPKEEFLKEKTGMVLPEMRGKGLVMPPLHERMEQQARNQPELDAMYNKLSSRSAPAAYNALTAGLVTSVKNQGQCGSCVAFASSGLFETCMIKAGAKKSGLDLSDQYLVDCAYGKYGASGCNGANPYAYAKWLPEQGGQMPHETSYPYLGTSPKLNCNSAPKTMWNSGAKVTKGTVDWTCGASKLKSLIHSKGAVAVGVAADSNFGSYKSGIFNGCTGTQANHAVLAVGYGTENGQDYWLVKNSWGKNWGENGYIKIKRGTNMCGIEKNNGCITADCTATGTNDATPTSAPTTAAPSNMWCKVSWLPADLTGNFRLHVWSDSGLIVSQVKCVNGSCTPATAGPTNACVYICGA